MATAQLSTQLPGSWRALAKERAQIQRAKTRIRRHIARTAAVDPVTSAEAAELRYVCDTKLQGIRRIGRGARVRYIDPAGRTVAQPAVLQRIRSLAIPPAWNDVWISPDPLGHLQATGRDARGRKQYRYHSKWRQVRDEVKYGRLLAFAAMLPRIRSQTASDLRLPGLPREKVLATVVQILEKTLIRVGNKEYARDNHSFGLTTMRDAHAVVNGSSVRFEFRGKSGISHMIDLNDARLTRIVKACRDLPGHELFQYVDAEGKRQTVGSSDVNQYVREVTGQPFTSKDFRTWAGTVLAAQALAAAADGHPPTKRNLARAIATVAKHLGNTAAVCRKCYIHPVVVDCYLEGNVIRALCKRPRRSPRSGAALSPAESAVVALLGRPRRKHRLSRAL